MHGVAVGDNGLIIRTTDGGVSWLRDTIPWTEDLMGVYMLDSVHIWAVGDLGLVLGYGPWTAGLAGESGVTHNQPLRWPSVMRAYELARFDGLVFDVQGQNVTALRQTLGPGTYFLVTERLCLDPRSAVRKVVIQH
jgi:hypothetical protein